MNKETGERKTTTIGNIYKMGSFLVKIFKTNNRQNLKDISLFRLEIGWRKITAPIRAKRELRYSTKSRRPTRLLRSMAGTD